MIAWVVDTPAGGRGETGFETLPKRVMLAVANTSVFISYQIGLFNVHTTAELYLHQSWTLRLRGVCYCIASCEMFAHLTVFNGGLLLLSWDISSLDFTITKVLVNFLGTRSASNIFAESQCIFSFVPVNSVAPILTN